MGRHTESWNIYANDSHTVNFFGQQLQWHTAGRGNAEVNDDNRVKFFWIGLGMDRIPNIFKKFSGNKGLRIKGHIAHAATGAVKV